MSFQKNSAFRGLKDFFGCGSVPKSDQKPLNFNAFKQFEAFSAAVAQW